MPDTTPRLAAPPGSCDCSFHVYDQAMKLAPAALIPGPAWATVEAYKALRSRLGMTRAAVVQPTAYGTDNTCILAAVQALGAADTRCIVVITPDIPEAELQRLHAGGARGVRFQMFPGGALPWDALEPVAARIAPLGWHIQLQMDGRLLPDREAQLARLPTPLVIDHTGKFLEPVPVEHPGFQALLRLLGNGRTWIKLAGAYETSRTGAPHYADVGALAKAALRAAPERAIWGSNWPHVSARTMPDDAGLLDLLLEWAPEPVWRRVLVENPAALFGF